MVYRKWDWAWKEFFNPQAPWCPWFISKLLGEEYADFNINFSSLDSLGEEEHVALSRQVADRYIKMLIDEESRTLHLEFQSTYDSSICLRSLQYDLQKVSMITSDEEKEVYRMTMSFIVNVRKEASKKRHIRSIILESIKSSVSLDYPVIDGYDVIPYIKDIMEAKSDYEFCNAYELLLSEQDSRYISTLWEDKLKIACLLISTYNGFDNVAGVAEEELEMKANSIYPSGKTVKDVWIEESLQKGLQQGTERVLIELMNNLGLTKEDALRLIKGDKGVLENNTSRKENLKSMNLN